VGAVLPLDLEKGLDPPVGGRPVDAVYVVNGEGRKEAAAATTAERDADGTGLFPAVR